MTLPRTIEELDGAWLSAALGKHVSITTATPISLGYATAMYRLELDGQADAPGSVIVKLPVGGQVRQLLYGLGAYRREATFYPELAGAWPLRVPKPYVAET